MKHDVWTPDADVAKRHMFRRLFDSFPAVWGVIPEDAAELYVREFRDLPCNHLDLAISMCHAGRLPPSINEIRIAYHAMCKELGESYDKERLTFSEPLFRHEEEQRSRGDGSAG